MLELEPYNLPFQTLFENLASDMTTLTTELLYLTALPTHEILVRTVFYTHNCVFVCFPKTSRANTSELFHAKSKQFWQF